MPADVQEELQRRLDELEALRRRVLNVIPHALRTPITTFRGLTEALPDASAEEIQAVIGPALRRMAAQAEHLLDDMLIAAGYTTALPTGARQPCAVLSTAREVWDEVGSGELVTSGDDVRVLVAPGGLFKVFVHLLDNARKYGEPPISVTVARKDDRAVIEVASGGTVTPEELPNLCEPFFRGEMAVMKSPGLGVGLTVARALIEQAGGSLELDRTPAGGLVVRMTLEPA